MATAKHNYQIYMVMAKQISPLVTYLSTSLDLSYLIGATVALTFSTVSPRILLKCQAHGMLEYQRRVATLKRW